MLVLSQTHKLWHLKQFRGVFEDDDEDADGKDNNDDEHDDGDDDDDDVEGDHKLVLRRWLIVQNGRCHLNCLPLLPQVPP